jgi:hypothetical protein
MLRVANVRSEAVLDLFGVDYEYIRSEPSEDTNPQIATSTPPTAPPTT